MNGYSTLSDEHLRRLASRMFQAKNYVLAAALFEAVGEPLSTVESAKLRYARTHTQQGDDRFASTAAMLPILARGYRAPTVAEVLGVEIGDAAAVRAQRLAQVVYLPSFHPEVILSLACKDGRTLLSMDAANVNLWERACLTWDLDQALERPSDRRPPVLAVHREEIAIAAREADHLWRRIATIPLGAPEREMAPADGMRVEGYFRDGRLHDFNVHLSCGGPGAELAWVLFEAASGRVHTREGAKALGDLVSYFSGSGLGP